MKIKHIILITLLLVLLTACGSTEAENTYTPPALDTEVTYFADIDIADFGIVTIKLEQESAPITCANFVKLANEGFYDGLTFHRIIPDSIMQGGDPEGNGTGGSGNPIIGEFKKNGHDNALKHTRGAIAMARSKDKNSASSQFYICRNDCDSLDGKYAVFGYVTEGIEVVDKVCDTIEPANTTGVVLPEDKPVINSVKIRTK